MIWGNNVVTINYEKKIATVKIVYFGVGESGKTTSLEVLHRKLFSQCGEIIKNQNKDGRTTTFDYLPVSSSEDVKKTLGIDVNFAFFTVPGQRNYRLMQKEVLRKVDGIIFVVDSHEKQFENNVKSLNDLECHLNDYGTSIAEIPMVFQYNKRDLLPQERLPLSFLNRQLNLKNKPCFGTVATASKGVVDAALKICQLSLVDFKNKKTRSKGNKK